MIQRLTAECQPPINQTVWFWRDDHKTWVLMKMSESVKRSIGHPELAYTYWAPYVPLPNPEQ